MFGKKKETTPQPQAPKEKPTPAFLRPDYPYQAIGEALKPEDCSEKNYIPGFDLFRIVGCILVVATHHRFFRYYYDNMNTAYKLLSEGIPVFFIISGYLSGRCFSRQRVFRQIIRYAIPYFFVEFTMQVVFFSKLFIETGENHLLGFAANILRCFVIDNDQIGITGQLWFILALLYAFFLNAWMTGRARKAVIFSVIILRTILAVLGEKNLIDWSAKLLEFIPLAGHVFRDEEIVRILNRFLAGLLFTTIGFDIGTWKVKPVYILLVGLIFCVLEICIYYLNIAVVFLSVALFYGIKALLGQSFIPIHLEISLFSVMMYFLHMVEKHAFYRFGVKYSLVSFLLVIVTNMLLTFFIAYLIRNRGRRISVGRGTA